MPPPKTKQTKGNPAKKEQVAEKVKEIQQRQKNWMRQRDEHLKTSSEPASKDVFTSGEHCSSSGIKNANVNNRRESVEHTAHGADILRIHNDTSQHLASEVSDKLNVKVKHGFGTWLQSRKQAEDSEDQTLPSGQDNREKHSAGMNNGTDNVHENQSAPSPNGVSALRSSNRSYPLSPAEFDSLADSIAARVKQDLGIKQRNGTSLNEGVKTVDENIRRGRTFVQGSAAQQHTNKVTGNGSIRNDEDAPVDVSSHRCPFCSSLMATPAHVPMLLVPCGHTVCKQCSSSHTNCPLCGTRIGSLTTNIMLHQIIQEFHRNGHQRMANVSSLPATAQVTWEREKGPPAVPPPKTTAKYRDVNYSAQLRSLQERRATLQEEARSRKREKDQVASKFKRAEKQVKAIEKEEESLGHQIQQLEERLQGLRQHKEEYVGEYRQLQGEVEGATSQLTLVEQTLKSLEEEIDKVQFLAEGQEDAFLQKNHTTDKELPM